MRATSRSLLHPLQTATSLKLSSPPPSSSNPRASELPPLSQSFEDPFQLPPPKVSSRTRGSPLGLSGISTPSLGASPFDPSQTLAPPRLKTDRSTGSRSGSRLPSLSQALEMHPELSPDPTSFRYPPGYEESLLSGNLGLGFGLLENGGLRRRSSLSKINESLTRPSGGVGSLLGGGKGNLLGPLPPFPAFDTGKLRPGDSFRSPAVTPFQGSAQHSLLGQPSSTSQQQQRSLRRMPSDATMQTSIRRQSLRDSDMARDAHMQYGRHAL